MGLLTWFKNERRNAEYTELLVDNRDSIDSDSSESQLQLQDEENKKKEYRYPWQVGFIVATEACERFSFYGMNAILTIYLIEKFKQTMPENEAENLSTIMFHLFKVLSFITPLLGAALADSTLGKFRTILYLSIVYAVGSVVLSVGAISNTEQGIYNFPNLPISGVGLLLIALGTGGIKPCVVSFGADQFKVPEQTKEMATYFAVFYAAINLGSLCSTIVTPYLRGVSCMGEDSCFSLAFGVPVILMFCAVVLFYLGKSMYTIELPERNVLVDAAKCVWIAVVNRRSVPEGSHWLEAASHRFNHSFIQDLKAVFRVGTIFLMYPMFWALYDQQGSRWTIQATKMNGVIFGFRILPDQMQVMNPLLILVLIPVFDQLVYPALGMLRLLRTPLQRIVAGCLAVVLSFVVSGILELHLKASYPDMPLQHQARLTVHNGLGAPIVWSNGSAIGGDDLASGGTLSKNIDVGLNQNFLAGVYFNETLNQQVSFNQTVSLSYNEEKTFLVRGGGLVLASQHAGHLHKADNAMPYVRLIMDIPSSCLPASVQLKGGKHANQFNVDTPFYDSPPLKLRDFGEHTLSVTCKNGTTYLEATSQLDIGGVYNIFVYDEHVHLYTMTLPNSIHIMWMLPQYFLITVGEILFSVTSLEFAYSQAPKSMKSIMQSLYYLTTAVGNLITLLVVHLVSLMNFQQYIEFFMFAGLLFLFSIALMIFTLNYTYVYYTEGDEEDENSETKKIAKD